MNKTYEKPTISIDAGLSEGVYAASGAGSVTAESTSPWDAWDGGGKGGVQVNWSGVDGTVVLTLNFNDTIDEAAVVDDNVQTSVSGSSVTLAFNNNAQNPMYVGLHLNHGTNIYNLQLTGYTHSVS